MNKVKIKQSRTRHAGAFKQSFNNDTRWAKTCLENGWPIEKYSRGWVRPHPPIKMVGRKERQNVKHGQTYYRLSAGGDGVSITEYYVLGRPFRLRANQHPVLARELASLQDTRKSLAAQNIQVGRDPRESERLLRVITERVNYWFVQRKEDVRFTHANKEFTREVGDVVFSESSSPQRRPRAVYDAEANLQFATSKLRALDAILTNDRYDHSLLHYHSDAFSYSLTTRSKKAAMRYAYEYLTHGYGIDAMHERRALDARDDAWIDSMFDDETYDKADDQPDDEVELHAEDWKEGDGVPGRDEEWNQVPNEMP